MHEDADAATSRGLRTLRNRIKLDPVPSSVLDETLNVATWNIRHFGKLRNRRYRTEAAIHYIAEILFQFDVIAIVELADDLHDLHRVMEVLGPYWNVIVSDYTTDRGGNRERIGFLYDERACVPTGLAAEADPPRRKNAEGEYLPTMSWWRSPYMASFRAGTFDFVLFSVHIRWGDGEEVRVAPLKRLAEWIGKRSKEKGVFDKDIIVMGDFNIPDEDDDTFKAITSKGLRMPDALRGAHGSNLARDKRYDQILHNPKFTKSFTNNAGVLDFFRGDWRPLFPAEQYPDMTKDDFTYELSDHLPLWVQLDTWTEDEELDQLIRRTRR
jgi:endonuclease/exonuclease/phosphatase family metal-dependent hydrolase